jgi:hypothetical protein
MDSPRRPEDLARADVALDFIRFCRRRRRVGWPELYDEMCAVAGRGLYHGWGFGELAEHGIEFGLAEMPRLAALVNQITREEAERRSRLMVGVMAPVPMPVARPSRPRLAQEASEEEAQPRLIAAAS